METSQAKIRNQTTQNIALVLLLFFTFNFGLALIQGIRSQNPRGLVLAGGGALLIALFGYIVLQTRAGKAREWHTWAILGGIWFFTNLANLLFFGLGLTLAPITLIITAYVALQLLENRRSLVAVGLGAFFSLTILVVEYWLVFPFRGSLISTITETIPLRLGIIIAALSFLLYQQFNRFSLRLKLIISFLFVSLVPLVIIGYLNDLAFRNALTQTANTSLASVADQTAEAIDTFIGTQQETVLIESQLPTFREFLSTSEEDVEYSAKRAAAEDLMNDLHDFHIQEQGEDPYLFGYLLLDGEGSILMDTQGRSEPINNFMFESFSQNPIFLNTALTGLPEASTIQVFGDIESASIFFASRVINEENQPIGALITRYQARFLQDIVEDTNDSAGEDSFGVLFDENQIHLAHGIAPDTFLKTTSILPESTFETLVSIRRLPNLPADQVMLDLPDLNQKIINASPDNPFFESEDIATGTAINQVAVQQLESYPWKVAYFQPQEIFLAPVTEQTNNSILIVAAVAGSAVLIAVFASTQLANPILRLRDAAIQVSEGNLDVQAEVETEDEIGALAATFNDMTAQLNQTLTGLEDLVAQRTARLQATNDIGRVAASILNTDDLINRMVNLISERFGYYYAAIFLVDENGEWAVLKEATGEGGRILMERSHRLEIGGNSMVGSAISLRRARIALDVGETSVRFDNPVLPDTRSEIALPLMVGDRVLGALDVQSTEGGAFSEDDIGTLQNMANQVAIAIENANLFERTQRAVLTQQTINQISTRIQSAVGVESILSTTISELSKALNSEETSIVLAPETPQQSSNGAKTNGAN